MPSVESAVTARVPWSVSCLERTVGKTSHNTFCMVINLRSLIGSVSLGHPHPIAIMLVPVLTPLPGGWAGGCGHHSQTPLSLGSA